MKSREQTAIEALKFYAEQQHFVLHEDVFDTISGEPQNWQEDESNTIMFEDGTVAKQALAALTPPAQGSIDADGLPPLPVCKLISGPSLASLHVLYTADQMHAYVLADRAAIHSNEGLLELVVAQLKERLAKADAQIERLESAARQSAAPGGLPCLDVGDIIELAKPWPQLGYIGNVIEFAHAVRRHPAPAPSEPVPQGVPEGDDIDSDDLISIPRGLVGAACYVIRKDNLGSKLLGKLREYTTGKHSTAPTTTSGGEAVALPTFTPGQIFQSSSNGVVEFLGLDSFHEEVTYKFRSHTYRKDCYWKPEALSMHLTLPAADAAKSPDANIEKNRELLLQRSIVGLAKYGVTTADNPIQHKEWLQHALEESLDMANYLQAAINRPEPDTVAARKAAIQEAATLCNAKFMARGDTGHAREASTARSLRDEILDLINKEGEQ